MNTNVTHPTPPNGPDRTPTAGRALRVTPPVPTCPAWCDRTHAADWVHQGGEFLIRHTLTVGDVTVEQQDHIARDDETVDRGGLWHVPLAVELAERHDVAVMAADLTGMAAEYATAAWKLTRDATPDDDGEVEFWTAPKSGVVMFTGSAGRPVVEVDVAARHIDTAFTPDELRGLAVGLLAAADALERAEAIR